MPILGFGYSAPDAVPSTTSELKVTVGDLICSGTHFDSFLVTLMHMYLIVTSKRFSVEDISQFSSINLIVISRGLSFNRVSGLFFITPCTFACVTYNFHSFADSINTFIEGPLDWIGVSRYIVELGETFDLSFELKIDHWWDDEGTTAQCCEIAHFEDGHHL